MKIELIDDFAEKYPKLWSVRFNVLAGIASIFEAINAIGGYVLPALQGSVPLGTFAVIAALFTVAGLVARGIKQFWPETGDK